MHLLKFRILTATSLICVGAFLLSSSVLGSWDSIWKYCNGKAINASDRCIGAGMSPTYCADIANRTFANCINRLTNGGTTLKGNYPSPTPTNVRPVRLPPVTVGNNPNPVSTPTKIKPILPVKTPVTNRGPIPSPSPTGPTIYAKPKPTQSPRSEHPRGHHG